MPAGQKFWHMLKYDRAAGRAHGECFTEVRRATTMVVVLAPFMLLGAQRLELR